MKESSQLEILSEKIKNSLNLTEQLNPDLPLAQIGINSLNIVNLILICEELYPSFSIDKLLLNEATTLRDIDQQLAA